MNIFGKITLAVALSISIVAAYYSIAGLAAIFAAAVIPVIIMGTVLEVAKITTAVWLHLNWKNAPFLMKTYLTTATVVLMFITSMGIFGFLSKAHVEQTAISQENVATLEQIEKKIFEQEQVVTDSQKKIEELSNTKSATIEDIQKQIDQEQGRVDQILARIQPSIDEQNKIIEKIEGFNKDQISKIDIEIEKISVELEQYKSEKNSLTATSTDKPDQSTFLQKKSELTALKSSLDEIDFLLGNQSKENIKTLQSIIGVKADGINGQDTRAAIQKYRNELVSKISALEEEIKFIQDSEASSKQEKSQLIEKRLPELEQLILLSENKLNELKNQRSELLKENDPRVVDAQKKIEEIRLTVDDQLKQSNLLIQSLREEIKKASNINVDESVSQQRKIIENARNEISLLTNQKYSVESELRKLEAEVGPVKYIAELVYGNQADKNMLETAVRWVILLLVFVFDPLAVILVLAGIRTLEMSKEGIVVPTVEAIVEKPKRKATTKKTTRTVTKRNQRDKVSTDTKSDEIQLELDLPSLQEKPKSTKRKPKIVDTKPTAPVLIQKPKN